MNIDKSNQLHPFYLIYLAKDGQVISNHLSVKNTLDILRLLCKGKSQAIPQAFDLFNEETDDGKNMETYSDLLNQAIESILDVKDQSAIDSLFTPGGTSALTNQIKGLEDFELLSFIVVN